MKLAAGLLAAVELLEMLEIAGCDHVLDSAIQLLALSQEDGTGICAQFSALL
jgi:hypothetical protein